MKKTVFTGAGVAISTPMNADMSINYEVLGELIDFNIENKTDSIVICGTTGEATTMSDEEQVECIRYAVERTAGRVPVVAGVGSNNTEHAIWLSKQAAEVGADALLHVTPYYNKTSQAGLVRHFTACADATNLPVILYNVPGRTNLSIQPKTYLELSKHPNIVATKEASGDISAIAHTIQLCGDELAVYSGNDDQIVPLMSLGAIGVISVLSNIMPKETHDICELYLTGDTKASAALQLRLLPIIHLIFCDVSPMPIKAALNLMGYNAGDCRLPLVRISDSNMALLSAEMRRLGLIS